MSASPAGVWRTSTGDGPHLVLVHGTMDRSASFGRVIRALDGWHITRYDRRGYGRSTALGAPTSFDDQVADLVDVIGDDPAVVVGHSYGGTVAVATAERHPALVRGVLAYESPMPWMSWWPTDSAGSAAVHGSSDPAGAAEAFMRRMIGDRRWERLPPTTRAARRAEGATLVAELAQLRAPNPPAHDPTRVTCPVLAACGSVGAAHHQRSAHELGALAPDGDVVVVDDVSHGIHLSAPAALAGLIERLAISVRDR